LVFTACTKHEAVATEKQASTTLDTVITNFSLPDINGKTHSLTDYKSSKAIVLMFISTECPVSNAYNSRMAAISKDYSSKDITFLGINSNKAEDVAAITKHAAENGLDFTILKDNGNVVADQLAASFTPEIYVLSGDLKLLYHGRIDDKRRLEEVTSNDLQKALDEILAGKPVSVSSTKAFGCTIKRVD
jgi:peroxiredoxin